ncbi:MAG: hypothetical protein ACI4ST_04765 [Candidatus Gallimonas sp.]
MFKLYTEKDVKTLVTRLREEYEGVVRKQRIASEEIKEENRKLRARLSVLEGERENVSSALLRAEAEGERIRKESSLEAENERKELCLLSEKCRLLLDRLLAKYPDEEDVKDFRAFYDELKRRIGEEEEEPAFDMDAVLAPQEPLDLGKLCKDLGLMEDDS